MITADLADKALQANLLQRLRDGKRLSPGEIAMLRDLSGQQSPADTWPTMAAASRALGLSPARLRTLAGKGCPLDAGPGGIERGPALTWLWQHRDQVDRRKGGGDESETDQLKADRLRLMNQRMRAAHLAEATTLATHILTAARDGVRRRLSPTRLAEIRQAADDTALSGLIDDLVDRAVSSAIASGAGEA